MGEIRIEASALINPPDRQLSRTTVVRSFIGNSEEIMNDEYGMFIAGVLSGQRLLCELGVRVSHDL